MSYTNRTLIELTDRLKRCELARSNQLKIKRHTEKICADLADYASEEHEAIAAEFPLFRTALIDEHRVADRKSAEAQLKEADAAIERMTHDITGVQAEIRESPLTPADQVFARVRGVRVDQLGWEHRVQNISDDGQYLLVNGATGSLRVRKGAADRNAPKPDQNDWGMVSEG